MSIRDEFFIIIVDADRSWSGLVCEGLTRMHYRCALADNAAQALEMLPRIRPRVIVYDIDAADERTDTLLATAASTNPPSAVILTSSNWKYDSPAVSDALRNGAFDCLIKPLSSEVLIHKISQALALDLNFGEKINRKLAELQVVSTYSERLMGMVDKYDVIRALFETSVRHLDVDFVGFLVVQRRTHDFFYWSGYAVDEKMLREFCNETVAVYNRAAGTEQLKRRPRFTAVTLDGRPPAPDSLPELSFRHSLPLCRNDLRFGAVIFGAVDEPELVSGKLALLNNIVGQTRIALANTKLYGDMKENYIRTIKALAIAVDAKDTYTHGHSENVMTIAEEIAREMGIDVKAVGDIRDAGLLHDIGKIGIPGYILNKPGPLTYEEFNGIMKTHSTLGANIVRDVPFLRDLYKLILHHHEHFDGKGYPEGLKGEQIPIGARVIHVADAFEAMTSNRPYRDSLGRIEAFRRLSDERGRQFDPVVIDAFFRLAKRKGWIEESGISNETHLPV